MKSKKILIIDNYDSFTFNLYDYFRRLGASCTVIRNDETTAEKLKRRQFDALVLSPGPKRPADAGILMESIEIFHQKRPILGICLGHQALGEFFGASLVRARLPMHGKTSMITHNQQNLFQKLPNPLQVMRYHSLVLENLPQNLEMTAKNIDILGGGQSEEIMAIQHKNLPIAGVQFHPESILTPNGLQLLRNWMDSF